MHTEFPKLPSATNYCELVMGQPRTVVELILKEYRFDRGVFFNSKYYSATGSMVG